MTSKIQTIQVWAGRVAYVAAWTEAGCFWLPYNTYARDRYTDNWAIETAGLEPALPSQIDSAAPEYVK